VADSPELEGLRAELEILRLANKCLVEQVALRDADLRRERSRAIPSRYAQDQQQRDLLVAAWHLLKTAERSNVFGRASGVGELLKKIEGHVPKEDLRGAT
jgi:hypothetical protein